MDKVLMENIDQLKKNTDEWARLNCEDLNEYHDHLVNLLELVNAK